MFGFLMSGCLYVCFFNVWLCVCFFLTCGFVYVWLFNVCVCVCVGFCNVCLCVCLGFLMCDYVYVCVLILYCVIVL
jgi:hypothetical protein